MKKELLQKLNPFRLYTYYFIFLAALFPIAYAENVSIKAVETCDAPFVERNGLVVIQAESLNLPSGWQKRTSTSGYTGSGYIEWTGAPSFSTPGVGLIETTVRITKTGRYYFRWYNKVGKGDLGSEHNDSWLRMPDASNFYATGARTVYPYGSGKTPNPNGAGSGGWFKVFTNGGLNWNWNSFTSDRENLQIVAEFNAPGVYKIQISARSDGHLIDRLVLYHSSVSTSTALSLSNPETRCTGDVVTNKPPTANAGSDQTITQPASSITLTGSGSDPEGSSISYQWRQQSGPSQAMLTNANTAKLTASNLVVGTYVFRLTVTDNQGGTATDDVTVRVDSAPSIADQKVTSFTLINADTEQPIRDLVPNDVINLARLPTRNLNIRANTDPERVGSVRFVLSGRESRTQVETGFPYSLFGDEGGNYNAWTPAPGDYTLAGTPFPEGGGNGTAGTPLTVNFSVIDQPVAPVPDENHKVTSFTLINADTEQPIRNLVHNDVIDLSSLPTRNLSIRANTNPDRVGSVKFVLSGRESRTQVETGFPYSLYGDEGGNYNSWTPAVGDYTLAATPYTEGGSNGTAGVPLTISFRVVEQPVNNPPGSTGQQLVSFTLINADTDQPLRDLVPNDVLNLSTLPTRNLSIRANTNPEQVGSVKLVLSGQENRTQTETGFPYSLFGDEGGNYNAWTPPVGNYTLIGTPYTERSATGTAGTPLTLNFSVVDQPVSPDPATGQQVISFTLMNADTDQPIRDLMHNEVINLSSLPTRNLSIRANTNPNRVGSVKLVLSGQQRHTQTETGFPYSLFGDEGGNYNAWTPAVGDYTLIGTPYTEGGGRGTAGAPLTISFRVTNQSASRIAAEAVDEVEHPEVLYYPNPFTESFTLKVNGAESGKIPAVLFDTRGQVVMQLDDLPTRQNIKLGKELVPGVYILHVGIGSKVKAYKLIKTQ
ncbi:PKD domain-containing protein [Telluribacter sp. SYSU D00476]|uniref:PKD domain-containing protein n=1 Tax=Telluribacter sp. SYSU D00476 TaxID=2811430 RepID=UPI001FF310F4|nr:T9SS type A sorting domain-containing protein [Telluribacter sp. SYSU D00476]